MKKYVLCGFGRMGAVHKEVADSLGWECLGIADPGVPGRKDELGVGNLETAEALRSLEAVDRADVVILAHTTPSRMTDLEWLLSHPNEPAIITEKPFANSLKRGHQFLKSALERETPVVVNHQRPYFPVYRKVREFIDQKKFGELVGMTISGVNFGLANNVTHWLELASGLFESRPETVSAWLDDELRTDPRGAHFQDHSGSLIASFGPRKRLFIDFRSVLAHGNSAVLSFEQAQVVVDELRGTLRIDSRKEKDYSLPPWRYARESDFHEVAVGTEPYAKSIIHVYGRLEDPDWKADLQRALWAVEGVVTGYFSHLNSGGNPLPVSELSDDALERVFPWA